MDTQFTANEARVIGCLMEKSAITPDQYPLSLNALVNACNQKSSREPVLSLEQNVVQRTVNDLIARKFVMIEPYGARVDKYRQRFCNTQFAEIQLSPAEFAIVCLLLLRGPQTPGELKAHSGRLHEFADPGEVDAALESLLYEFADGEAEATLESLLTRADGPFVARLPREPRRKDHAYAHLFSGPIDSVPAEVAASPDLRPPRPNASAALEERVAALERDVALLKQALGTLTP